MSSEDVQKIRAEDRADAKAGIALAWSVERHDNRDGSIAYEVWSAGLRHRVCRISDEDNPCAKRDAEHIAEIHNAALAAKGERTIITVPGMKGGGDPTKPGLLKPRGNNGVVDTEICFNALLLVGDVDLALSKAMVACWTSGAQAQAYDWAVRLHLNASDNDDVYVPPRPAFVPRRAGR